MTTRNRTPRRGNIAIIVAVSLTALLGFAALTLDSGMLLQERRRTQAAADAAAMAAASDLYYNYQNNNGLDPSGTARAKALAVAAANGYSNDGVSSVVTVNIPPTSGPHTAKPGYAEVIVESRPSRGFSVVWGNDRLRTKGRAVGLGKWTTFKNGILVLDPTSPGALNNNGGGRIKVVGADVIVNSNAPNGGVATGGGYLEAPTFAFSGNPGVDTSGGGQFIGTILTNQPPTPDPLAYIPAPDPSTMTLRETKASNYGGKKTVNLLPGVYQGGIHVSGQVTLNMAPGIYYMDGGGFTFTGQGDLNALGVMIYTAPKSNSDVISINGLGSILFTPPFSGRYKGIALWQERSSTNTISITGNGNSQLYGTIYGQHALLSVQGNGTQDVIGSQYISYDVNLGGNGNFNITWDNDVTARTRFLYIVE